MAIEKVTVSGVMDQWNSLYVSLSHKLWRLCKMICDV
jgi:hypothetical protein